MSKSVLRIIGSVLVFCLLADPSFAAMHAGRWATGAESPLARLLSPFDNQALSGRAFSFRQYWKWGIVVPIRENRTYLLRPAQNGLSAWAMMRRLVEVHRFMFVPSAGKWIQVKGREDRFGLKTQRRRLIQRTVGLMNPFLQFRPIPSIFYLPLLVADLLHITGNHIAILSEGKGLGMSQEHPVNAAAKLLADKKNINANAPVAIKLLELYFPYAFKENPVVVCSAYHLYAVALEAMGRLVKARAAIMRFIEIDKKNAKAIRGATAGDQIMLDEIRALALMNLTRMEMQQGHVEASRYFMKEAVAAMEHFINLTAPGMETVPPMITILAESLRPQLIDRVLDRIALQGKFKVDDLLSEYEEFNYKAAYISLLHAKEDELNTVTSLALLQCARMYAVQQLRGHEGWAEANSQRLTGWAYALRIGIERGQEIPFGEAAIQLAEDSYKLDHQAQSLILKAYAQFKIGLWKEGQQTIAEFSLAEGIEKAPGLIRIGMEYAKNPESKDHLLKWLLSLSRYSEESIPAWVTYEMGRLIFDEAVKHDKNSTESLERMATVVSVWKGFDAKDEFSFRNAEERLEFPFHHLAALLRAGQMMEATNAVQSILATSPDSYVRLKEELPQHVRDADQAWLDELLPTLKPAEKPAEKPVLSLQETLKAKWIELTTKKKISTADLTTFLQAPEWNQLPVAVRAVLILSLLPDFLKSEGLMRNYDSLGMVLNALESTIGPHLDDVALADMTRGLYSLRRGFLESTHPKISDRRNKLTEILSPLSQKTVDMLNERHPIEWRGTRERIQGLLGVPLGMNPLGLSMAIIMSDWADDQLESDFKGVESRSALLKRWVWAQFEGREWPFDPAPMLKAMDEYAERDVEVFERVIDRLAKLKPTKSDIEGLAERIRTPAISDIELVQDVEPYVREQEAKRLEKAEALKKLSDELPLLEHQAEKFLRDGDLHQAIEQWRSAALVLREYRTLGGELKDVHRSFTWVLAVFSKKIMERLRGSDPTKVKEFQANLEVLSMSLVTFLMAVGLSIFASGFGLTPHDLIFSVLGMSAVVLPGLIPRIKEDLQIAIPGDTEQRIESMLRDPDNSRIRDFNRKKITELGSRVLELSLAKYLLMENKVLPKKSYGTFVQRVRMRVNQDQVFGKLIGEKDARTVQLVLGSMYLEGLKDEVYVIFHRYFEELRVSELDPQWNPLDPQWSPSESVHPAIFKKKVGELRRSLRHYGPRDIPWHSIFETAVQDIQWQDGMLIPYARYRIAGDSLVSLIAFQVVQEMVGFGFPATLAGLMEARLRSNRVLAQALQNIFISHPTVWNYRSRETMGNAFEGTLAGALEFFKDRKGEGLKVIKEMFEAFIPIPYIAKTLIAERGAKINLSYVASRAA